jgi:biopolymer transport protein ExbB/TolQ
MSLSDEVAELRRLLPELRALQGGCGVNTATITINAGLAGVAVGLAGCIIALVAVVMLSARISDMRTDMQSERIERKMHEIWAVQEANTMRTFAKTGVLAPMEPRPKPQEATK